MDVTSATNTRTTFAAVVPAMPHGHSAPILVCGDPLLLSGVMNSFVFDWAVRRKQSGLHLVWSVLEELPLPPKSASTLSKTKPAAASLSLRAPSMSVESLRLQDREGHPTHSVAVTDHERLRHRACLDALIVAVFGLGAEDIYSILHRCDLPNLALKSRAVGATLDPKGFWRVDKDKDPELRHTVLTLVAFHDLEEKIRACGGDREKGIEAFLGQNDGEGWMLPETLRLADYGLGHDERAKEHQPVASRLGPRFYDWQLAQSLEESWRECHLHARNLLGEEGYKILLDEIAGKAPDGGGPSESKPVEKNEPRADLLDLPLFR
jgi:hypothetical protein